MQISRINTYQKLYHEIIFVIQCQMLDDMQSTVRTMRTKMSQLRALILRLNSLNMEERSSRIGSIRVKLGIYVERVMDD